MVLESKHYKNKIKVYSAIYVYGIKIKKFYVGKVKYSNKYKEYYFQFNPFIQIKSIGEELIGFVNRLIRNERIKLK